ncbi:MAG: glycosyltransferase family A protein [Candidatus Roizmanbacteria bacterium]
MKVSIIVPVYNEEKNIKNCLDSLIKQEEKPEEIIIVDNNCTDKTFDIVKKYPGIIIIKEKKQGIAHARNAGFNTANGDILAKCDADTILPTGWIKKVKKAFTKKKDIVAYVNHFIIYDIAVVNRIILFSYLYQWFFKIIGGYYILLGPALAIRKITWQKIKNQVCVDDKLAHEDIDLSIHVSPYGKIFLDKSININISGRRMKYNPLSFFIEYPFILLKMLKNHRL